MKKTKTNPARVVGVAMVLLMLASQAEAQKPIGFGLSIPGNLFMSAGTADLYLPGASQRVKGKMSIKFETLPDGVAGSFSFYKNQKGLGGVDELYLQKLFAGDTRGWSRLREDYRKSLKLKKPNRNQRSKKMKESVEQPSARYRKGDQSWLFPGIVIPRKFRAMMAEPETYQGFVESYRLVPVSCGLKFVTCKPCKCECDPCDWTCCWLCGGAWSYHDVPYKRVSTAPIIDALMSGR